MTHLSLHIEELSKTLNPIYGPETPSEAVNRLLGFYQRLDKAERFAFVATLIGEVVTARARAATQQLRDEQARQRELRGAV